MLRTTQRICQALLGHINGTPKEEIGNATISLINSASATKALCKALQHSYIHRNAGPQPTVPPLRKKPANGRARGKPNKLRSPSDSRGKLRQNAEWTSGSQVPPYPQRNASACVCVGISDEAHHVQQATDVPMIPVPAGHARCGVQAIKSAIIRERCNPEPVGDQDCERGHMAAELPILPGTCLAA
ncbi:hypothetical protein BBK36DRAFT_23867 [Trichoderma citrinoviride]|uniref:Uncharacterized protein n=1 Tax=Trichoderma citrinoviride TaxID=58853 RepID=A0A2T4AY59_9HYPO|nr:hypothetical protein BBK36DRAFT_23867 [Trichoderma citrinoviride]PTB62009.1 hypothetical protein BBK36DRAFT_23867 [Trichoderma citrinoviride]